MRRVISVVLSLMMLTAVPVTAFAADEQGSGTDAAMTIRGTTISAVIYNSSDQTCIMSEDDENYAAVQATGSFDEDAAMKMWPVNGGYAFEFIDHEGNRVTPADGCDLTISSSHISRMLAEGSTAEIYAVDEDGSREMLSCETEDEAIEFHIDCAETAAFTIEWTVPQTKADTLENANMQDECGAADTQAVSDTTEGDGASGEPDTPGAIDISEAEVTGITDTVYTGDPITMPIKVVFDGMELSAESDYTAEYKGNTDAGTATITITGTGEYQGTLIRTFTITKADIRKAQITGITDKSYDGKAKTQAVTVTYNGKKVHGNDNYTVDYKNNTGVGTASVTITGKGNFDGSRVISFKITDQTAKTGTWSGNKMTLKTNTYVNYRLPDAAYPSTVLFTAQNDNSIKVNWTDCKARGADITGYIIFRRHAAGETWTELARVSSTTTAYYDRSAKNNSKLYYYLVVSYKKDASGNLAISNTHTVLGCTYNSGRHNPYWPVLDKTSASVEKGSTVKLNVSFSKYPKKCSGWIRWRSSNTNVAKVSSNGVITGMNPGTATIYAKTANGRDLSCKVTVKAPKAPAAPHVYPDYTGKAGTITFKWDAVSGAAGYEVYMSDGSGYKKIAATTGTRRAVSGLEKGKTYYFYVRAYKSIFGTKLYGSDSNIMPQIYQPVRKTTVTGIPASSTARSRSTISYTARIANPAARTAYLDMYENGKWVAKGTVRLPNTVATRDVKISLPGTWWTYPVSTWRVRIPASDWATAYTSPSIKVTSTRFYQNPSGMIQLSNAPSKHGQNFYMSPCKVNNASTRADHIERMIARAYDYLGDPFVVCRSTAPGYGVDCSGIVMQAGYAAGVDFYPSTPYRHTFPAYEYESREIWKLRTLKTVAFKDRKRGDLIFYANAYGTVIHIAIYLGNDKIIHSWPGGVRISSVYGWGHHIIGVKRVFN